MAYTPTRPTWRDLHAYRPSLLLPLRDLVTEYACAGLWACVPGQTWSVDC